MSRIPVSLAVSLVMTALVMCGGVQAATENAGGGPTDATGEALEQLEHDLNNAILAQDQAALDRLLADDCTTEGNQVRTKAEYIEQILANVPPKSQTLESVSVKLHGNTAVVTARVNSVWVSPAGAGEDSFQWVTVWVHGGKGWQAVHFQSTALGLTMADGC